MTSARRCAGLGMKCVRGREGPVCDDLISVCSLEVVLLMCVLFFRHCLFSLFRIFVLFSTCLPLLAQVISIVRVDSSRLL